VTDAYPDRVYDCRVDEISPEANRQKATIEVKVKIGKPDDHIRPDMNARVTFLEPAATAKSTGIEEKLYIVPKRAVVDREAGKMVLVVVNGEVQAKPIIIKKEVSGDVFVSAGLIGNEAIIVSEQLAQMKVGDRVRVLK
jgi:HlyD family secretion protein